MRQERIAEVVRLSVRGHSYAQIAKIVGVTPHSVMNMVHDEYARRAELRDQDKEQAIARYEAVILAAWERYDDTDSRSLNASGLLNTIRQAQDSINKITGAEAPRRVEHLEKDEWVVVWDDLDEIEQEQQA